MQYLKNPQSIKCSSYINFRLVLLQWHQSRIISPDLNTLKPILYNSLVFISFSLSVLFYNTYVSGCGISVVIWDVGMTEVYIQPCLWRTHRGFQGSTAVVHHQKASDRTHMLFSHKRIRGLGPKTLRGPLCARFGRHLFLYAWWLLGRHSLLHL